MNRVCYYCGTETYLTTVLTAHATSLLCNHHNNIYQGQTIISTEDTIAKMIGPGYIYIETPLPMLPEMARFQPIELRRDGNLAYLAVENSFLDSFKEQYPKFQIRPGSTHLYYIDLYSGVVNKKKTYDSYFGLDQTLFSLHPGVGKMPAINLYGGSWGGTAFRIDQPTVGEVDLFFSGTSFDNTPAMQCPKIVVTFDVNGSLTLRKTSIHLMPHKEDLDAILDTSGTPVIGYRPRQVFMYFKLEEHYYGKEGLVFWRDLVMPLLQKVCTKEYEQEYHASRTPDKIIQKIIKRQHNEVFKQIRHEHDSAVERAGASQRSLAEALRTVHETSLRLKAAELEKPDEGLQKEWDLLMKHPAVDTLMATQDKITLKTKQIPIDGVPMGPYTITIKIGDNTGTPCSVASDWKIDGWSHPHFADTIFCLGGGDRYFWGLLAQWKYCHALMFMIEFIGTYNRSAGHHYKSVWQMFKTEYDRLEALKKKELDEKKQPEPTVETPKKRKRAVRVTKVEQTPTAVVGIREITEQVEEPEHEPEPEE